MKNAFKLSPTVKGYLARCAERLAAKRRIRGFTRIGYTWSKAYANEEYGIVIKKFGVIVEPKTPKHLRVPTIKLGGGWVVQPIVETSRAGKAMDGLRSEIRKLEDTGMFVDFHIRNVGHWLGEPVLFDW